MTQQVQDLTTLQAMAIIAMCLIGMVILSSIAYKIKKATEEQQEIKEDLTKNKKNEFTNR